MQSNVKRKPIVACLFAFFRALPRSLALVTLAKKISAFKKLFRRTQVRPKNEINPSKVEGPETRSFLSSTNIISARPPWRNARLAALMILVLVCVFIVQKIKLHILCYIKKKKGCK